MQCDWTTTPRRAVAMMAVIAFVTQSSYAAEPFVIETEATYHASFGAQYTPDVAYGDGVYLTAWTDLRTGGSFGLGYDPYAQLTTTEGDVLFEGSLVLQRNWEINAIGHTRVAWNGSVFLVVWNEAPQNGGTRSLVGLRIAADGTILDSEPIVIDSGLNTALSHDVASDGDQFLVTYAVPNANFARVDAKRVSGDGTVIDTDPIVVRPQGGSPFFLQHPRIAFGSGVFMVIWLENEFTRASRVTPQGQCLDPGGVQLTSFAALWGDIASDGVDFMVAWTELDNPSFSNAGGGILSPETMTIDTFQNLTTVAEHGISGPGAIEFDGTRYMVLIYTPEPLAANIRDLWGRFVESDGVPSGEVFPIELMQGADQGGGGLATDGVNYFASWEDSRDGSAGDYSIYGKFIPADGGPVGFVPKLLSPSASWQISTATAFDGENYLVVWEDWRNGPFDGYKADLYGARVTPEGVVLDDPAFLIANDLNREKAPQLIYGGGQYFVVYEYGGFSTNVVRGARILPDGTVLDPDGFTIAAPIPNGTLIRPRVAFNGEKYLVVYHNNYGTGSTTGILGKLVGLDGVVQTPTALPIATQSFTFNTGFHVASDGNGFLVTWMIIVNTTQFLKATRVGNEGQIQGTTLLYTSEINLGHSRVAYNGQSYLVVWRRGIPSSSSVQAVRVATNGQPMGDVMTLETQTYPHIDVVASDDTFVIPYYKRAVDPPGYYMKQLSADGEVMVEDELIHAVPFDDLYGEASLASGPGGDSLMAFSTWSDMPHNAPRIRIAPLDVGAGSIPGDGDGDGDVDLFDFALFLDCVTGTGGDGVPPGCSVFDFDADNDVDFTDFGAFQLASSG